MLIICPECSHSVSDRALSCPSCGYPLNISAAPRRKRTQKKHKKLPNGFGSIKKLSGTRKRPFAAYPATTEFHLNGSPVSVPAIGYYEDWYAAFSALQEYNKNPYDLNANELTFKDVYELYYNDKYVKNQKRKFSQASIHSTVAAYKNCSSLHDKLFRDLRKPALQKVIDDCPLKHASLELIISLLNGMYRYALQNDLVEKNYAEFVTINIPDDDESGEPFTQEELDTLWQHKDNPTVQMILIMIYSGFRIKAFETIKINMEKGYFQGGVKTAAGKNRIVPIHTAINAFIPVLSKISFNAACFRTKDFYSTLEDLQILHTKTGKKHTPHDCRHTFSWLCDHYGVDSLSKHLLMGHSLGGDVESSVYGHRTFEELKAEIEKIKV